jgi:adenylate cyclase
MILTPVLAVLGFISVGRMLAEHAEMDPGYLHRLFAPIFMPAMADMVSQLKLVEPNGWLVFALLVASVLIARAIRHVWRNRHGTHRIRLPNGRVLEAPHGQTILETLRIAGIPHASVCGGRGRCTTCRIHVGAAIHDLPAPSETEARALARIGADAEVRLACQTRPVRDLAIHPLLPAAAGPRDAYRSEELAAREQAIAVLFLDIRGSTRLGERKLPYDVLFTLNQFFAEMSPLSPRPAGTIPISPATG